MTQMLTGTRRSRRERSAGLIQRLQGADMSDGRQDRLNAAMVAYETACREGNETAKDLADIEIDNVLSEARGEMSTVGQTEEPPAAPVSFDGGVQRRTFRPPYMNSQREPGPAALIKQAMKTSQARRSSNVVVPTSE
jgi:hypothetical protein